MGKKKLNLNKASLIFGYEKSRQTERWLRFSLYVNKVSWIVLVFFILCFLTNFISDTQNSENNPKQLWNSKFFWRKVKKNRQIEWKQKFTIFPWNSNFRCEKSRQIERCFFAPFNFAKKRHLHIVWKSLKMSHLNFYFGIFNQFLSY